MVQNTKKSMEEMEKMERKGSATREDASKSSGNRPAPQTNKKPESSSSKKSR